MILVQLPEELGGGWYPMGRITSIEAGIEYSAYYVRVRIGDNYTIQITVNSKEEAQKIRDKAARSINRAYMESFND